MIIHVIRTNKIPFIQSRASVALIATTVAIMLVGIWLPFSPIGPWLGLVPLPMAFWPFLSGRDFSVRGWRVSPIYVGSAGPIAAQPVGIDVLAGPFSEPTLIKIAGAYEAAPKHRTQPTEFGPPGRRRRSGVCK